jgi:hypothetical protein
VKRRITVEQLQELTEEQKKKLNEWWRAEGFRLYDIAYDEKLGEKVNVCNQEYIDLTINSLPLLDIGQMIEILGHRLSKIDYDGFINNYYVQIREVATYGKYELVDALWEAVKNVLTMME